MNFAYEDLCIGAGGIIKTRLSKRRKNDLKESIDFLCMDIKAEAVESFARLALITALAIASLLAGALTIVFSFSFLWIVLFMPAIVLYFYLRDYPRLKAKSKRGEMLSMLPMLSSRLSTSLRVNPNLEKAVEFSARHSKGILKEKLLLILSSIELGKGDVESGLRGLSKEFKEDLPEFEQTIGLLLSSTKEEARAREESIDRANEILMEGFFTYVENRARRLATPVMAVFTFGVILPLVFVAVIPFLSLMGIGLSSFAIGLIYLVALPSLLFVLTNFVSGERPATMPVPTVKRGRNKSQLFAGLVLGAVGLSPLALGDGLGQFAYLPFLWAVSLFIFALFFLGNREAKKEAKRLRDIESSFPEKLHELSSLLSEGKSLESALAASSAEYMSSAAERISLSNCSLRDAFFDPERGSLKDVPSEGIKSKLDKLVSIEKKGSHILSGAALGSSKEVQRIRRIENDIERQLGSLVSSMRIIAMAIAPLVGGMVASMGLVLSRTMAAQGPGAVSFSSGAIMQPSEITAIIATYVLFSAGLLMLFANRLLKGKDNLSAEYAIGFALPVASMVFFVCAAIAGSLFGAIA